MKKIRLHQHFRNNNLEVLTFQKTSTEFLSPGPSVVVFQNSELLDKINAIKEKAMAALNEFRGEKRHLITFSSFKGGSLKKCTESLKAILSLFIESKDFKMAARIYQLLGEVAFLSKHFPKSIFYFTQAAFICETYRQFLLQSKAYESIGRCYIRLRQYQKALVVYKMQLIIGWRAKSSEIELRAYDNIGMAYYYIGDLDAAQYYHHRMWAGICESRNSPWLTSCQIRDLSVRLYQRLNYHGLFDEDQNGNEALCGEILMNETELCSAGFETPRIINVFPWEKYNPADLPSPRKSSMPKQTVKVKNIKIGREIQRYIASKFTKKKPFEAKEPVFGYNKAKSERRKKGGSPLPQTQGAVITHLSPIRYSKFQQEGEAKLFLKTYDCVKEFPNIPRHCESTRGSLLKKPLFSSTLTSPRNPAASRRSMGYFGSFA